jgi:hypothetical protein
MVLYTVHTTKTKSSERQLKELRAVKQVHTVQREYNYRNEMEISTS